MKKIGEELEKARGAIQAMEVASDLDAFEEAWKECLHRLERTWYKIEALVGKEPRLQGWNRLGRMRKLRKQDPLLSYLRNARGADEHTLEEIAEKRKGGVGVSPAVGDSLYIDHMVASGGSIHVKSPDPLRVNIAPARMKLLPITNRGKTYLVPKRHRGQPIRDRSPVGLARLAVATLDSFLDEVEAQLAK